jgi:hypothetical protein
MSPREERTNGASRSTPLVTSRQNGSGRSSSSSIHHHARRRVREGAVGTTTSTTIAHDDDEREDTSSASASVGMSSAGGVPADVEKVLELVARMKRDREVELEGKLGVRSVLTTTQPPHSSTPLPVGWRSVQQPHLVSGWARRGPTTPAQSGVTQ